MLSQNCYPVDYLKILILNEQATLKDSLPFIRLWGFTYLNIMDFNNAVFQFGTSPKLFKRVQQL